MIRLKNKVKYCTRKIQISSDGLIANCPVMNVKYVFSKHLVEFDSQANSFHMLANDWGMHFCAEEYYELIKMFIATFT